MTITPIAFNNLITGTTYADLAYDADLRALHPDMDNNRWSEVANFRATLSAAFDQLLIDLAAQGWTSSLINNTANNRAWFKQAVIFGALVTIFRDFRADTGDRWDLLRGDYYTKYNALFQTIKLDYDQNEDGTISTEEEKTEGGCELIR